MGLFKSKEYSLLVNDNRPSKPIAEFTPAEAKANFEWFVANIPLRMVHFAEYVNRKGHVAFDYSQESIAALWKWYVDLYHKESKRPVMVQHTLRFLSYDLGVYVGECLVRQYQNLTWQYRTKPKTDAYRNLPIVGGFSDGVGVFEPQRMLSVVCQKLAEGRGGYGILPASYKVWILLEGANNPYRELSPDERLKIKKEINRQGEME